MRYVLNDAVQLADDETEGVDHRKRSDQQCPVQRPGHTPAPAHIEVTVGKLLN
jgi:hypothetical protein